MLYRLLMYSDVATGEKIVKIGKYLAKIWPKYDSLVFLGHPVYT